MMHKNMGYFNGWKFGVPITMYHCGLRTFKDDVVRLIHEDSHLFTVVVIGKGGRIRFSDSFGKKLHSYIPISHKVDIMQPRFLVCTNGQNIAYCNVAGSMARLDAVPIDADVIEVKELRGAQKAR